MDLLVEYKFAPKLPNQISVNYYDTERYNIVKHKDGKGKQAVIVSLGSATILEFFHEDSEAEALGLGKGLNVNAAKTRVYDLDQENDDKLTTYKSRPDSIPVFLEPGSAIVITGKSFVDYAHAIYQAKHDTVSSDLANFHLVSSYYDGETVKRMPRVS
eukprot:CAMPEP_0174276684 /NCGR_PEP_ID=MMETSP0439-20130205/60526_1 /TAXON_ID=0 /ORGANISM="Stereomyxa ramosa, Strain Chinc5" /LENGTH=157 /DNA_ID=CAMNT_0015368943 /DNA_START=763 /DNA_END=1232 /DNA_ORIENTATION=+